MKKVIIAIFLFLLCMQACFADVMPADTLGVIRVFGESSSWISSCFVIGDGSWVLTTADSLTEKIGAKTTKTVSYPIFISPYTGQAYECEVKAVDESLNVALLKLPVSGLPSLPLAENSAFSKAYIGTTGELMKGEPVGGKWPTAIYGISREKSGTDFKLSTIDWTAAKVIITDMDKYKYAFISDLIPDKPVKAGSMVLKSDAIVGIYINTLTFTANKQKKVIFGRCALSTDIFRFASANGADSASLILPPKPGIKKLPEANAAFQLYARIYSSIAAGVPSEAADDAARLVKMRPTDAQAHLLNGIVLNDAKKTDLAVNEFNEAIKLDAKLIDARVCLASALIDQKKNADAEKELLNAAELAPLDYRPAAALADFYLADIKTSDKALEWAKKYARIESKSPQALLKLAQAYKHNKDYVEAVNNIKAALQIVPDWADAWYAAGVTYEAAGDLKNAETCYNKLVELDPKNIDNLLVLASFLADQHRTDEAKAIIKTILEQKPSDAILAEVEAIEKKLK